MAFNKKSDTSCENPLGFWPKGFPGLKKTQAALRCGIVGHVPTGRSHWPSWNPRNGLIYRGRRKPQAGVSAASLNWKSALQECCIQLWPTGRTKGFWSDSLHIFAASQSEVNYPKTKNKKTCRFSRSHPSHKSFMRTFLSKRGWSYSWTTRLLKPKKHHKHSSLRKHPVQDKTTVGTSRKRSRNTMQEESWLMLAASLWWVRTHTSSQIMISKHGIKNATNLF